MLFFDQRIKKILFCIYKIIKYFSFRDKLFHLYSLNFTYLPAGCYFTALRGYMAMMYDLFAILYTSFSQYQASIKIDDNKKLYQI